MLAKMFDYSQVASISKALFKSDSANVSQQPVACHQNQLEDLLDPWNFTGFGPWNVLQEKTIINS